MLLKIITTICLSLMFSFCFSQIIKNKSYLKLEGRYQKVRGNEILILKENSEFICLRNYFQKSDVIIPRCDTLAKGFWNQRKKFITLKNRFDFNKFDYSILESEINSNDSIYFKIVFPKEDALNNNIFKFSIVTSPMYGKYYEFDKPEFAVGKKGNFSTFNLGIKNISPTSYIGRKSYQRIYFDIFERYSPKNSNSNFFTVTINNFNQCFYEAMDLEGEIVGIEGGSLFWRGNIYKKIK